jgi:hypothetical protein
MTRINPNRASPKAQQAEAKSEVKSPATRTPPASSGHSVQTGFVAGAALPKPAVTSQLEFFVHPGLGEVKAFADSKGWAQKGWTQLSTYGVDLVYSSDQWKTTRTLNSSQVPSPFVNGRFTIPDLPKGTSIEFAVKVYVAASDPHDIGGHRDRGEVWLNNGGKNFTQVTH